MKRIQYIYRFLIAAMAAGFAFSSSAIITSDGNGTHVVLDGQDIVFANVDGLPENAPDLDHDSVQRLFFDRPGLPNTWCSSALISTPQGKAVLIAAHCITDSQGQMVAANFQVTYPSAFGPVTLGTNDPSDVKIHPNYDGTGWHGYDLALVFVRGNTFGIENFYSVYDGNLSALHQPVVKFGFGQHGWGGSPDGRGLDDDKRWGLNKYESYALGDFGVLVEGGWNNTDVQLTMDFDDGSQITHNLYNFYGNFEQPHAIEVDNRAYSWGFFDDEVMGARCPRDAGAHRSDSGHLTGLDRRPAG